MEHLEFKIEDGWLWIEDRSSRFEDFIMPHQHLIFLSVHCRKSAILRTVYSSGFSALGRFTTFSRFVCK